MATNLVGNYGSDQTGMICGYLFLPGLPGKQIESGQIKQCLANACDETSEEYLWLHFNLSNTATEKWLKSNLTLSEQFFETLHEGSQSTRIEYADRSLIGVVNDVLFDFAFNASDTSTLWMSADRHLLITARIKPLRSIDKLRDHVRAGILFRSPVDLMVNLLRDQADVLMQIVREAAIKVDKEEDNLLTNRPKIKLGDLGALRRVLVRLCRLLAPEPAALFRLLNRPPEWVSHHDVQDLRQSTEEFSAVLSDIAALVERIKLLQEEIAAKVNEQTNRSIYILTVVTVLALPVNIIAGLMGMNVGGIPLAQHPHGFWIIVSIIILILILAAAWAFRKKD
ncbi:transporter [Iodobacter sp. LRB]|uniref:transporter n=1 Tax=unclassified Iodobacter TaxID=235634 RepID=UPI000C0DB774|nr:transporter [Iodobacter sp. BJB302]PHV02311.1 magnesium transporter CorA [Iodobacter sp. BJB302]